MPVRRDIIVIGASAGGIETVRKLAAALPADLQAAVFIVNHLPARGMNVLPRLLDTAGPLPAREPEDGEKIETGRIYVAPPDHHVLLARDHVHITRGPKEGRQRPCINVTFRSAAMSYGPRVIGVILTGLLDDGTAGLWEIKRRGGLAIVQDPADAIASSMPESALQQVEVDYCVPISKMGPLLSRLSDNHSNGDTPVEKENPQSRMDHFSGFTCPDCRGPLWETAPGRPLEFTCRVQHSYSPKALLDEHTAAQERKLYEAIVALEEGADLSEYLAARVNSNHREHLITEAEFLRNHALTLRKLVDERKFSSLD